MGICKPPPVDASNRVEPNPAGPSESYTTATPSMRTLAASGDDARVQGLALPGKHLISQLHAQFCHFQVQAKGVEVQVEATQMPVDGAKAHEMLRQYSCSIASEIGFARDALRHGQWKVDERIHLEHDMLCFCLAVWELVHELVVNGGPSAPLLLHWYNRHYLEEDIAKWWQQAQAHAEDPETAKDDFWQPLYRLALSDCHEEVLSLLQRKLEATDPHVAGACELLRRVPSLHQMHQATASLAEFHQATQEIREAAQSLMQEFPADHPANELLRVYAGCSQDVFDAGGDIAAKMGRTWVEDVAYAHAWVYPGLCRTELGELLRTVAKRRTAETIDDVDRVFLMVLTLDIPGLLQLLASLPERFPPFFVGHLVDVLYFAGRVPFSVEPTTGEESLPPRDWHLMTYARQLQGGSRLQQRYAVDYLRTGGSPAAASALRTAAEEYCAAASTDAEMEDSLALLDDLNLTAEVGPQQCHRHAEALRAGGDLAGSLRWACRAASSGAPAQGSRFAEFLDALASEDLEGLLGLLTPPELDEPLAQHPPKSLLALLAPASPTSPCLGSSGRLYFYSQFARCCALQREGRPASEYAPVLVRLLAAGAAPACMANALLGQLLPVLVHGTPVLSVGDTLLLMRYVQASLADPLRRVRFSVELAELHHAMTTCLSHAVFCSSEACGRALGDTAAGAGVELTGCMEA